MSGGFLSVSGYLATDLTLRVCCKHCCSPLHVHWHLAGVRWKPPKKLEKEASGRHTEILRMFCTDREGRAEEERCTHTAAVWPIVSGPFFLYPHQSDGLSLIGLYFWGTSGLFGTPLSPHKLISLFKVLSWPDPQICLTFMNSSFFFFLFLFYIMLMIWAFSSNIVYQKVEW